MYVIGAAVLSIESVDKVHAVTVDSYPMPSVHALPPYSLSPLPPNPRPLSPCSYCNAVHFIR